MKEFKPTNETKNKLLELFNTKMDELRETFKKDLAEGKIADSAALQAKLQAGLTKAIEVKLEEAKQKAFIVFTPLAYIKMTQLVKRFSSEVAWHGVVEKIGKGEYLVSDIIMFKQQVTGVTVDTDDDEYTKFIIGLDPAIRDKVRLHGHSHVNMACNPSTTDIAHRNGIKMLMRPDSFYIFMIHNKKNEFTAEICDAEDNVIYEAGDIEIDIGGADWSVNDFIEEAEELVVDKSKTYKYTEPYNYPGYKSSANAYGWLGEDDYYAREWKKKQKEKYEKYLNEGVNKA